MAELSAKIALVTGASSGIGEATALRLAAAGARVGLAARRTERIEALARRIAESGGEAVALPCDVARLEDVRRAWDALGARFGPPNVLVSNAGVMLLQLLKKQDPAEWRRMLEVNVLGALHGIHVALPGMIERGDGHIVNVSSTAGRTALEGAAVYCGTKFALGAISDALRKEVAGTGVRVTLVEPGTVKTELGHDNASPRVVEGVKRLQASQGIEPDAIARAVAYAISQPPEVSVFEVLVRPSAAAT